jgi:beta-1,4-mannosyltransferase
VHHAAADVVVLPYDTRSALNSGALLLALSLDTPVVVADSPINRELRRQVGADWVHLFDGDPAEALAVAKRVAHARRAGRPDLDAFAWPAIAEATVQAYRDVLGLVPSPDHQEQPA